MGRPVGQGMQILTFRGSLYVSTRVEFNFTNGVATQAGKVSQELSGSVATDALPPRDDSSIENNGHVQMIPTTS